MSDQKIEIVSSGCASYHAESPAGPAVILELGVFGPEGEPGKPTAYVISESAAMALFAMISKDITMAHGVEGFRSRLGHALALVDEADAADGPGEQS